MRFHDNQKNKQTKNPKPHSSSVSTTVSAFEERNTQDLWHKTYGVVTFRLHTEREAVIVTTKPGEEIWPE